MERVFLQTIFANDLIFHFLKPPNDSHKLRGLTHSFALKHSPKSRRLPAGRSAHRQLDAGLGLFRLEILISSLCRKCIHKKGLKFHLRISVLSKLSNLSLLSASKQFNFEFFEAGYKGFNANQFEFKIFHNPVKYHYPAQKHFPFILCRILKNFHEFNSGFPNLTLIKICC